MENKDVTIQNLLDEKRSEEENKWEEMADDADFKAYNLLYNSLKEMPEQNVSSTLKSGVINRLLMEKKQADDTRFYWFFSVISGLGIGIIAAMFYILKDAMWPFLTIIIKFKGFIIMGIVAILFSSIIDKKLVKNHS